VQLHLLILLLALILDAVIGDPDWLWRRLSHPIVLFGHLINYADKIGNNLNFSARKRFFHGFMAAFLLLGLAAFIGWMLAWLCQLSGTAGIFIEAVITSVFLAQKSLACHVRAVGDSLEKQGLVAARRKVAMIVGRNPNQLDEAGICRAAIESLSENSSDGIIAPAFWFLLLGLPGLLAYKMLNTADSMIGHKNTRYANFGFCTARADDFANILPARLTVILVVIATFFKFGSSCAMAAAQIAIKDAKKHHSPNAGWPESAYAGALGISLAGPRSYGAQKIIAPFQNENARPPCPADIFRALSLFWITQCAFFVILSVIFIALSQSNF